MRDVHRDRVEDGAVEAGLVYDHVFDVVVIDDLCVSALVIDVLVLAYGRLGGVDGRPFASRLVEQLIGARERREVGIFLCAPPLALPQAGIDGHRSEDEGDGHYEEREDDDDLTAFSSPRWGFLRIFFTNCMPVSPKPIFQAAPSHAAPY